MSKQWMGPGRDHMTALGDLRSESSHYRLPRIPIYGFDALD